LAGAAVAGFAVLLWNVAPVRGTHQQRAADLQQSDAGTSAVGDTSPTQPRVPTPPSQEKKPVAQEPLPEPLPGQIKPDKSGRCPGRKQVLINGGCWFEMPQLSAEECVENNGVLVKSKCYAPVFAPPKKAQPTSSPPEER
jgi:serine/threonine-protein kinase